MRFIVFVFGLIVGSFLNVVIYRLPRGLGFVKGRSFCPKCKKKIRWFDNVPLISFVLLKGRCRFCRSPISWRYPLVEFLSGALFVLGSLPYLSDLGNLSYLRFFDWGLTLLLFSALIVIFFIDLEHQIIPDEILLPLIIFFVVRDIVQVFLSPLNTKYLILNTFAPAVGAFLFLFLIYIVTKKEGMGFGDVKLAFLMGLVLGYPKIVAAMYIAFLTGAIIGIILVLNKRATFKQKIAFGPFLTFATITSFLWGEKILNLSEKLLF